MLCFYNREGVFSKINNRVLRRLWHNIQIYLYSSAYSIEVIQSIKKVEMSPKK